MFTGIVETLAKLKKIEKEGSNQHFYFQSNITNELKIDQSVAHNGVCLTVVGIEIDIYKVTAIKETLDRTNIGNLGEGDIVNIERCMKADGRFDGHIVQGHVDTTAKCIKMEDFDGSTKVYFEHPSKKEYITVEKGSITINGISLTVVDSTENTFSVAIIPYTWEHTNFKTMKVGDLVNLEFDVIGKYVAKLLAR